MRKRRWSTGAVFGYGLLAAAVAYVWLVAFVSLVTSH
jgi:hypothetical protein